MALIAGFVAMAPEADPKKHRASIKSPKLEITTVIADVGNFDQVVKVCQELVQREGVKSLILCPGFSHEAVARVIKAVGPGVAVSIARGDTPSTLLSRKMLKEEGW